jgi:hypothetical protein
VREKVSRYSQLYIERGDRQLDSKRFRVRLSAVFFYELEETHGETIGWWITKVQGYPLQYDDRGTAAYKSFFKDAEIRDILDFITGVFRVLEKPEWWVEVVTELFDEEHLAYRIDPYGLVHPYVDQQFQLTHRAAVEALNQDRFRQARNEFESAFRHLRGRENVQALRMMFPAVETAAKVLFPGKFERLTENEIDRHLRPTLEARYAGNDPAVKAGRQLLEGMRKWVTAAHQYRHGAELSEPVEPPDDFTIAHLSAGATYLRWMIELCSDPATGSA